MDDTRNLQIAGDIQDALYGLLKVLSEEKGHPALTDFVADALLRLHYVSAELGHPLPGQNVLAHGTLVSSPVRESGATVVVNQAPVSDGDLDKRIAEILKQPPSREAIREVVASYIELIKEIRWKEERRDPLAGLIQLHQEAGGYDDLKDTKPRLVRSQDPEKPYFSCPHCNALLAVDREPGQKDDHGVDKCPVCRRDVLYGLREDGSVYLRM